MTMPPSGYPGPHDPYGQYPGPGHHHGSHAYGQPQFGQSQFGQQYGARPGGNLPAPVQHGAVAPGYGYPAARKSPGLALFLSFLFPGLGTMVAGSAGRGILIFGLYVFAVIFAIVTAGIGGIAVLGIWIWGMIDGYSTADRHNRAHGIHH